MGGELVSTPGLTLVVPQDMVESYGGRTAAAAWDEGVACHTTLMGVELGSIILDHLHLGCLISYLDWPIGYLIIPPPTPREGSRRGISRIEGMTPNASRLWSIAKIEPGEVHCLGERPGEVHCLGERPGETRE
ncbi:hypothetical protein BHE74_00032904 [Ensete ventricosum]|nr:hypothetical protein BHE74_00032904 [Ensete ventricosum]